ncbi:MAG: segregation/condensation protein A [Sphingomonadaceae bacterium]|nr:segregation/condensation protein A [Sphingomonadaceae bacterium]
MAEGETLTLALGAWEGPLDLLLSLARAQKVDLAQISILALVDQYLAFIARARAVRLEVAADYLVMAAWLAYLKSCLLLPPDPEADPDPHELAARLQRQLERLEAMRDAAARLMARDRMGVDTFRRARPEGLKAMPRPVFAADYLALVSAYGGVQARRQRATYTLARRDVFALDAALERLGRLVGPRWTTLAAYLPAGEGRFRRSALASTFVAALELTRQGRTELAQDGAALMVRSR